MKQQKGMSNVTHQTSSTTKARGRGRPSGRVLLSLAFLAGPALWAGCTSNESVAETPSTSSSAATASSTSAATTIVTTTVVDATVATTVATTVANTTVAAPSTSSTTGAESVVTTPTTTAVAPAAGSNGVVEADVMTADLPLDACQAVEESNDLEFTGGSVVGEGNAGIAVAREETVYTDLDGDGADDAIIQIDCSGGGSQSYRDIVVLLANATAFSINPDELVAAADLPPAYTYSGLLDASAQGSTVTIEWLARTAEDPRCCPSLAVLSTGTFEGTSFKVESTEFVDSSTGEPVDLG